MYRCATCKEPIRNDVTMGFQCIRCGSRIFMKERPPVMKRIVAE